MIIRRVTQFITACSGLFIGILISYIVVSVLSLLQHVQACSLVS